MKKFVLLLCLGLGACSSVPGGTAGVPTTTQISDTAKTIQTYTKLACSFIPTVATIASILSSGASAGAAAIASDICAAVTTAPLADGGPRTPKLTYNNRTTVIKGAFVK